MSHPVIRVENLSKKYRLGVISAGTLRDDVQRWWHRVRRLPDPMARVDANKHAARVRNVEADETLWALRNVSFEVYRGEVLGIIGRNGAGKSTLLKLMSRVTAPTQGSIRVRGRIASLLEVGTGFHPELTGRENIFLNGAILGMTKAEVLSRLDEIIAFSEIDNFIDTPVKRYSSGMYVRLAFAVAAHLDPDILIVDEVLAVGDAAFQKKCLGKISSVANDGRTVLFVSHNMTAIATMCRRAMMLHRGQVIADGKTDEVIEKYYESMVDAPGSEAPSGDDSVSFLSARVVDGRGSTVKSVDIHEPFAVEMTYRIKHETAGVVVPNYHFRTPAGVCCFVINAPGLKPMAPGTYLVRCDVPGHFLNEGSFAIDLAATSYFGDRHVVNFWEKGLLLVTIRDPKISDEYNYGYAQAMPGVVRPRFEWRVKRLDP